MGNLSALSSSPATCKRKRATQESLEHTLGARCANPSVVGLPSKKPRADGRCGPASVIEGSNPVCRIAKSQVPGDGTPSTNDEDVEAILKAIAIPQLRGEY